MREILFRGQIRRKGEKVNMAGEPLPSRWVYGGIFPTQNDFSVIYGFDPIEKYPVYSETVGQYTGLTDKNGTKIFEGDILKRRVYVYGDGIEPASDRLMVGNVIWCEEDKQFPGFWSIAAKDEHGNPQNYAFTNDFEVIGNIYDNPELLEANNG